MDAKQRRAVVGEPEQALEPDRDVEVAARPEAPLGKGVESGEAPFSQRQPGAGVGADDPRPARGRERSSLAALRAQLDLPVRPTSPSLIWTTAE